MLLDHVRWLSAFAVLCGHSRNALFLPYVQFPDLGLAGKVFYALTNLQNEAVICFFVISGLLVGGKLLDYAGRSEFPLRAYVIDRLSRLYVVLIPALALSYGVAALGYCQGDGVSEWLGAVFYLQHILVRNTACNMPLWSLANEFWYYALGLAAVLAWRGSRLALGAGIAVAALLLLADSWNSQNVLLYLPFWAAGMMVFWLPRPVTGRWAALALFGAALLVSRSHILDGIFWLRDALIAMALVLFLATAAHKPSSGHPGRSADWGRRLAGFSFTLYLTHWPVLLLYTGWVEANYDALYPLDPRRIGSYATWFGAVLVCVAFAASAALVTEAKTAHVRAFVRTKLGA
ncbi:O-antigen acetylase [Paramagnetospirillum magnetotacticum MS-1]|uniref:O-antigen acetylase n=1 Tax=Paramagnetospirillum magnetotacticum MS-1 TaxID=272627 RepID=A0A0C2UAM0_PARME|nr:acyltransferase [Paramagnetospirillum magnetotacticum]KIL98532.1 O-antigen acetylase [Paramagnetospirillum magnetotacticum MS-1]